MSKLILTIAVAAAALSVTACKKEQANEANATMNLFSTARKEVPNPKEVGDRLKEAFQRYFMSLATRAGKI